MSLIEVFWFFFHLLVFVLVAVVVGGQVHWLVGIVAGVLVVALLIVIENLITSRP